MQPNGNTGGADPWLDAMRRGDLATAWAASDATLAARDRMTRDDPRLPYHLRWVWDGRRFDRRHVLVRCYHGLGDSLQFARYLAPLRRRAASLTVEVQPDLLPLFRRLPGPDRLIPFDWAHPAPPAECDLEIMELPHALRLGPAPPPPLAVSAAPIAAEVALCWSAGDWDARRSVPLPDLLDAIGERPVASVQRGPAAAAAMDARFINPGDGDRDILRTAGLLTAVKLVVTVDTMVAHLAGSLGRPTLLLLHADCDWRWMQRRADSPWYPSLRLLRQAREGDWTAPLAALRAALRRRAAG